MIAFILHVSSYVGASCRTDLEEVLIPRQLAYYVLDFEAYCAPTSRSRMSKIFRDLESLGKIAGKKDCHN